MVRARRHQGHTENRVPTNATKKETDRDHANIQEETDRRDLDHADIHVLAREGAAEVATRVAIGTDIARIVDIIAPPRLVLITLTKFQKFLYNSQ